LSHLNEVVPERIINIFPIKYYIYLRNVRSIICKGVYVYIAADNKGNLATSCYIPILSLARLNNTSEVLLPLQLIKWYPCLLSFNAKVAKLVFQLLNLELIDLFYVDTNNNIYYGLYKAYSNIPKSFIKLIL